MTSYALQLVRDEMAKRHVFVKMTDKALLDALGRWLIINHPPQRRSDEMRYQMRPNHAKQFVKERFGS